MDDDNFTLIKERVYAVCEETERRVLQDLFIRWGITPRAGSPAPLAWHVPGQARRTRPG